jgi:hypothetical protein
MKTYLVLLAVVAVAFPLSVFACSKDGQLEPPKPFDPKTAGDLVDPKTLTPIEKRLNAIIVPEIDLRCANIYDIIDFFDHCIKDNGAGIEKIDKSRVRLVVDKKGFGKDVPLIHFASLKMPLLYALRLTCNLGDVKYKVKSNTVTIYQPPKQDGTAAASPTPAEFDSVAIVKSPVIMKGIYGSRSSRRALAARPETTADAVMRCLRWFKATQNEDGSWGGSNEEKSVLTGFVLLAYLSHGETPASNQFGKAVENCIMFLIKSQGDDGVFASGDITLQEHAIATWAVCETYGLTKIPMVREAAEKAVRVVLSQQNENGLWGQKDGMEIAVWNFMALRSARMAGLERPEILPSLAKVADTIKNLLAASNEKHKNAPAIFAMQLTGHGNDLVAKTAIKGLEGMTMDWDHPEFHNPIYYWYFTTQAKFHCGGQVWSEWNKTFAPMLIEKQMSEAGVDDKRIGHWVSPGDNERYGKVYTSALCCLMLGNYSAWHRPFFVLPPVEPEYDKDDIDIEIDI